MAHPARPDAAPDYLLLTLLLVWGSAFGVVLVERLAVICSSPGGGIAEVERVGDRK